MILPITLKVIIGEKHIVFPYFKTTKRNLNPNYIVCNASTLNMTVIKDAYNYYFW